MPDQSTSSGIPYGAIALLVFAALLYVVLIANLSDSRSSDAAGRGMAMGFAAIAGILLWIVLAALFALAIFNGRMPAWAAATSVVLLPLSAVAAAVAVGLHSERGRWLIGVPYLLPPLLALYAMWARLPGLHGTLSPGMTSVVLVGAIVVLTAVPLALTVVEFMPNPARDAARAEQERVRLEQEKQREQAARENETARFARLGPDSSLRDYLDDLPPGAPRHQEALAGARQVKSRNADVVALLKEGEIGALRDLWRLDIAPASVCEAFGAALKAEAAKIVRTRSDYLSVAIDLERQLPNIKWLVGARCNLDEALAELEVKLRAVSDSPRLDQFAAILAALRQPR